MITVWLKSLLWNPEQNFNINCLSKDENQGGHSLWLTNND